MIFNKKSIKYYSSSFYDFNKNKSKMKKGLNITLLISGILFLLCLLITLITRFFPNMAEVYSLYIYPVFAVPLSFIFSFSKNSVANWVVFLIPFTILILIFGFIIGLIKNKKKKRVKAYLIKTGKIILVIIFIVYILFSILCGINYNRISFSESLPYEIEKYSKQDLYNTTENIINKLNIVSQKVKRDEIGIMILSKNIEQTAVCANNYISALNNQYPVIKNNYSMPKNIFFSQAMSYIDIMGIYFPFTVEANINSDILPYHIGATMCHEKAHQIGFMPEQEANFISYLACENSGDVDFLYSGYIMAFVYLSNSLYNEDKDLYVDLRNKLDKGVITDLVANNDYWNKFKNPLSTISSEINNIYLQANNQQDGVKSYGLVNDLLIGKFKYENNG